MRNCNNSDNNINPIQRCCYYIAGPTGPTGPQGPATITVGETTTGLPGTEASVNNSGTAEDVILDFVIPAGATGPQGPQGPTGATGPQGPTGTTPTLDSILVDNDGTQTVAADALVNLGTLINSTGSSLTFASPSTVNLTNPGTYYILYEVLVSNTGTASGDVGASLLVNDVIASNASEYVPATTTQTQIVLQHNITITDPTTITVSNESSVANLYHDSSLSIIKIG